MKQLLFTNFWSVFLFLSANHVAYPSSWLNIEGLFSFQFEKIFIKRTHHQGLHNLVVE